MFPAMEIHRYKMYSEADRNLAVELVHNGLSLKQAVTKTGVPQTTVHRLLKACKAHTGPCRGAFYKPGVWHSK